MIMSVLRYFDLKSTIYIEINALNYVSREMLSQENEEENLYSVTYFFKLMTSAECNYNIYNKKLLAIIHCLE